MRFNYTSVSICKPAEHLPANGEVCCLKSSSLIPRHGAAVELAPLETPDVLQVQDRDRKRKVALHLLFAGMVVRVLPSSMLVVNCFCPYCFLVIFV